ncbi:MAG: hypothetical protein LBH00_08645 [Planctomycetaceae bacterium]|jgi:hypothetical protein|nr:hypothetical protein [Planctomycetaceae bacterium]
MPYAMTADKANAVTQRKIVYHRVAPLLRKNMFDTLVKRPCELYYGI